MKKRLQKIISESGLTSRRKAETLIIGGRVTVNGETAALGDSADFETDVICVDGKPICRPAQKTYIMLNKPRGYVTTLSDEKGRRCVSELVSDAGVRLYPVGRLDMYSEGLLIMTDDGEFANRLMHPSSETEKTYHVWLDGKCSERSLEILRSPMTIDGYRISPARVEILHENENYTKLSVTIHEGRNRQIRKMCQAAGVKLSRLKRISEGPLRLGTLETGHWRYLSSEELQDIFENEI